MISKNGRSGELHGLSKPSVGFELTLNYYVLPFNPSLHMRSWRNRFARVKILAAKARENSSKRLLPDSPHGFTAPLPKLSSRYKTITPATQAISILIAFVFFFFFYNIYSTVIPKLLSTIKRRSKSIVIFNMAVDYANTCVIQ